MSAQPPPQPQPPGQGGGQLWLKASTEYGEVGVSFQIRAYEASLVVLENLRRFIECVAPTAMPHLQQPAQYGSVGPPFKVRTHNNTEVFMHNVAVLANATAPQAIPMFQSFPT